MHIRPEAYFKEEPSATSTNIFADIEEKLGRKLTNIEMTELQDQGLTTQEVIAPSMDPQELLDEDIDIIERI